MDGDLNDYRRALVKNCHLSSLANSLQLRERILLGDIEVGTTGGAVISHVSADCLEAILGAVFLDGGLEAAQRVLGRLFFPEEVSWGGTVSLECI